MSFFVNEELGEVPFDAIPKEATFAGLEELVDGGSTVSIHINLVKDGVLCFEAGAGKLYYLVIGSWLLCSKLIAWKSENLETLFLVLLIQLTQLRIIRVGQPTLRCNIDNEKHLPLVNTQIHLIPLSILDGEVVNRGGGGGGHLREGSGEERSGRGRTGEAGMGRKRGV